MYGSNPCRNLASPPFEAESYINQNIQAADWIATLIGRLMAYRTLPQQYADHEHMDRIFGSRVQALEAGCVFDKRVKKPQRLLRPTAQNAAIDPNNPFAVLATLKLQ